MQKGYVFLEHTADIAISAFGPSLKIATEQAAYAMFEALGSKRQKGEQQFQIEESAKTKPELVVNFLSAILAECEIREILPTEIKIEKMTLSPPKIQAKIYGTKERPKDHIKAVTYHQFKIEKKSNLTYIQVIFDV